MKSLSQRFPNVIVHRRVDTIYNHPSFEKAKNGDKQAAIKLIQDTINIDKIKELHKNYPNSIIATVTAIDERTANKIPIAYAEAISTVTHYKVEKMVQINDVGRTKKNAIERLIYRPKYTGHVEKGKNYILVDDVVTQGGTLNELKKYIEGQGGKVVACSTLGFTQYSSVLQITDENIKRLERKFGRDEIEKYLKEYGIGERIEDITNGEARHLLRFKNVERIRDRTANERNKRIPESDKTNVRKSTSPPNKQGITQKNTAIGPDKETARRTREMLDSIVIDGEIDLDKEKQPIRIPMKDRMAQAQEKAEKVNGGKKTKIIERSISK